MRVFDCFPFFNELELLEIRLHELAPVVDHFIIAESTKTFTGRQKSLVFAENQNRFTRFADKIIHIVVDSDEVGRDPWERQYHQRNALVQGLAHSEPDDIVLLSDVDEIPAASIVGMLRGSPPGHRDVYCLELRMFYYFLNAEHPDTWMRSGPRAVRRSLLSDMQNLRNVRAPLDGGPRDVVRGLRASWDMRRMVRRHLIRDAGWHFSYVGGVSSVAEKVASVSGASELTNSNTAEIAKRMAQLTGPGSDHRLLLLRDIDESFPRLLRDDPQRFADLFASPASLTRLDALYEQSLN